MKFFFFNIYTSELLRIYPKESRTPMHEIPQKLNSGEVIVKVLDKVGKVDGGYIEVNYFQRILVRLISFPDNSEIKHCH